MQALRLEADESAKEAEELKAKVKTLEQENLAKEQEITSLSHRLQVYETENEQLTDSLKKAKSEADESVAHGTQNEALTRRLQVLEDEAEEGDRKIRELNEK